MIDTVGELLDEEILWLHAVAAEMWSNEAVYAYKEGLKSLEEIETWLKSCESQNPKADNELIREIAREKIKEGLRDRRL